MHVPLFPRPPTVGSVATPISDVLDIATLPHTPASVVAAAVPRRHAVDPRSSLIFGTGKRHHRLCRNLVHPKIKDASSLFKDASTHRFTEFRVKMTEHHAKDNERDDDDDVICGVGRCYLTVAIKF